MWVIKKLILRWRKSNLSYCNLNLKQSKTKSSWWKSDNENLSFSTNFNILFLKTSHMSMMKCLKSIKIYHSILKAWIHTIILISIQIILKVGVMKIAIIESKVSGQSTVQMKSKLKKKDGIFEYSRFVSSTYSAKICL